MIKCDPRAKAKCPYKKPCCGDEVAYFLEGSECDKFNQEVLSPRPTNADRIRAMSDEELAKALGILTYNDLCLNPCVDICEGCPFSSFCANCIEGHELEWLQQPAEEVDHE